MTAEQINAVVEKYGAPRKFYRPVSNANVPCWQFNYSASFLCHTLGELLEQAVKTLPMEEEKKI